MPITLPTTRVPAETQDPRYLIIFSKVKQGKTSALAQLPNNLILDTERGTKFVEALKISITSVADIKETCKALKAANDPYDYITIDTMTALEDICKPVALQMYQNTAAGSAYQGDILSAPNGSGYGFLRQAIEAVVDAIAARTKNIILVCHSKDAAIGANELNVRQIDLLGKTGRILASRSDAIGYLHRDEDSNTILSFNTNDKYVECGARPAHLRNANIVLGEMQEDGTIQYHWERIYTSLAKKK